MNPAILVNGQRVDEIAATDRGLQYGDGLFETMAAVDGRIPLWSAHQDRLRDGCARLAIAAPETCALEREVRSLLPAAGRAVIKVTVTRGSGGRGYRPPAAPSPTRIVQRLAWPGYPGHWWTDGVTVRLCRTRLGSNPALAGIKHLNRLEQVLARAEWVDDDIAEGLMLDQEGGLVEGTITNVFAVVAGRLCTPPLTSCGVAGVMRRQVLELARERGEAVDQRALSWDEAMQAEELFLTNGLVGVWPIRAVEGQRDWGAPGPVARRWQARIAERMSNDIEG